jgi:phage I-like protein
MAENETPKPENQSTPDGAVNTDTQTDDGKPVPKDRFNKVVNERNQLKAQLAELEKATNAQRLAAEAAETARLKEQNDFKKLYEQAEKDMPTLKEKAQLADAQAAWFQETLTKRLEKQPAHIKTLLEKLPVLDALRWLEDNAETIARNPGSRSNLEGQAKGADMAVASLTTEEHTAAKRYGMTLEQYAEYKTKGVITRNTPQDK